MFYSKTSLQDSRQPEEKFNQLNEKYEILNDDFLKLLLMTNLPKEIFISKKSDFKKFI